MSLKCVAAANFAIKSEFLINRAGLCTSVLLCTQKRGNLSFSLNEEIMSTRLTKQRSRRKMLITRPKTSVADPGCSTRILIFTHPESWIQKTATKERGEKKFVVIPFYVATNFTKLKIILVFKC
jgi:hypothetical protein